MSLRTRLLLSYALVIFVCIAIIFVALLFLLRDAPVQKRLTTARLTVEASVINRLIRVPLQNGATPDQIMSRLQVASQNNDVRILLINDQSGQILADTDDSLTGRNLYQLGRPQRLNSATTGEFDSGGMHWLYSTRQVLGPRNNIEAVVTVPYEAIPPFSDPILRELLQPLLIALVLAFAVSIVLAILVTRSVTRPMQHVALAAQKIAAGEYNQAVPVEGPGEVKEMATNFNQMAQKVRDTQQIQRDFLANVSHELKTPLTSIQGFAQAIKDGTASDDEAIRKSGAIIFDEATRMTRMVGELLDLARMESGQIVMRSEWVQIDHVLRNVVEHMAMRAQTDGIHLQSEIADGLPPINGDGDRLSQVFNNLVDNALKHTPAGGTVTVAARSGSGPLSAKKGKATASGLEVSVVDTGSGIPPEDLPHIFERFYQVDKSRARSKSSSSLGLGLAIVREIVAAHGGTIHAESVVGLGTKFVIWLPIERGKIA